MSQNDPYELAYQIDRLMRRMNAGLERRAPRFDPERVGPIGGMILLTIAELQPVAMQHVADVMARDKAQLSRSISVLERHALLHRSAHESDKRSSLLSLTEKGADFVDGLKGSLTDVLGDVLGPLTGTEREQLLGLLKKL
ncbi:MAG: winged helix DNA-binding protein [Pseudomonadota bacterium]